ncbi:hypothetical protein [Sphingomonas metalli]|uniref:hypothetical protein n=1 Tax=Sphingomonas metalli TaxID=1779358 RepID=UPI00166A91D3|nr:hypothetical protein [Sphingomonas metalli]
MRPKHRRSHSPLPRSARGAILTGVALLHVAALLALLSAPKADIAVRDDRALSVFAVPLPTASPRSDPVAPVERPQQRIVTRAPAALRPVSPGGGRPATPQITAPVFAPPDRQPGFDATLVSSAPLPLSGALLPGPDLDGEVAGFGGQGGGSGTGTGSGSGAGKGGGGGSMRRARWIYQPGWREMRRYFPNAGLAANVSGRALLACIVPRPGQPERCQAIAEAPADLGFGAAAVRLSERFRIRPVREDTTDRADIPIIIPVMFQMRGKPLPPPLACPRQWCVDVPDYKGEPPD